MDYFHTMQGTLNQADMPRRKLDGGQAAHDVRLLAETPHKYFERGLAAMMAHWLDIGWGRFAEYVQGTWIDQLPGWWSGYLGTGTRSATTPWLG